MNEAGQGGWLDEFLRPLAKRRRRPTKRRKVRLELERLEDRLAPASTINIVGSGVGSLDSTLASNHGVISASDGGNTPGTLSDGALAQEGHLFGLNITAQISITFDDVPGGGGIDLGSQPVLFHANKGDITFANLSNTLKVDSGGPGSLFFQASGNLALCNLNAAPFETINLQAGGSLSVGALTAVNGIISVQAGGAVALDGAANAGTQSGSVFQLTAGGPVVQAAPIQTDQLILGGNGSFLLTDPGNAVNTLAGSAGGSIAFVDSTALALGIPADVNGGLTTTNAPISVVAGGALSVEFTVSAGTAPVDLAVNAPGQALTLDPNPMATPAISGASVTLIADVMSLSAGPINAGGGPVTLQTLTPSLGIDLGVGSNGLALSQADLNTITAAVLTIGGAGYMGDVTISGPVSDASAGWNILALVTGADINTTAGSGSLQVQNLALVAGEGIGDDGVLLTDATNLAFDNASGVVDIENVGALNLTAVDGLESSSNGGATTLTAGGPLAVEIDVASSGATTLAAAGPLTVEADVISGGTLTLATAEAGGADSPEEDVTVLSGVTVESTGGDVVLEAADSIVLEAGGVVKSDQGAVDLAVSVNDPDNDGVFDLQGTIDAPQGVSETPSPDDLALSLGGLTNTSDLPIGLNGSFTDTATAEAHTVVIDWGDGSVETILTLAAGVDSFSSGHAYASEGNFTASVTVANTSGGETSGDIIVPVLPANFGSVVAVDTLPGKTSTVSVSDPTTGDATTITLVRAAGAGKGGEFLAAKLVNATFPPDPGTVEILAAFDFREFNLSPGDRAFVSVTFPAVVPAGTIPTVKYLDPETGRLETFNPANPPGYLTITIGPGTVTVTLILDNTTIPKLTELTGTEFTVTAGVPSAATTSAVVSASLASADTTATAPGRTADFQSTSQLTFGLAASQTVQTDANLLALDAASSGGDDQAPADPGAAAARASWEQFVADQFPDDPQAVWEYGGDDAVRLWLARHSQGNAPAPVAPAPAPAPRNNSAPPQEEARLGAFDLLFFESLEVADVAPPEALRAAPLLPAAHDGARPHAERGAATPLTAPYVWAAAVGGLMMTKPERKRRFKVEGPPEGWRR